MEKEQQKMLDNLWVRVLLMGFSIIFFFVLCYYLRATLISLFLAFFVAYVFHPVVSFFERLHWPFTRKHIHRVFGIVFLFIAVFLTGAGFLAYTIPKTTSGIYQVGGIIKDHYPRYRDIVEAWIKKYENTEFAKSVKSQIKDAIVRERAGTTSENTPEQNNPLSSRTQESVTKKEPPSQKMRIAGALWGLKKYIPQSFGFLLYFSKGIFFGTFGILGIIVNFVIFGVVFVYLLKDFNIIVEKARSIFPVTKREQISGILTKINTNLHYFIRGQLSVCLILSLIYSIGLTFAGIPLSFLLGFLSGFGNLIPYMGTGIGIIIASALALLQFHDFKHILYIFITYGVGQILEGTVITPRIMGKGLGLSPVMVILSILICSQLLGFLGLLLAVPIASTVKVFVDELLLRYKNSRYYKE